MAKSSKNGLTGAAKPIPESLSPSAPLFTEPRHVGAPNLGSRSRFLELLDVALDNRRFTNDGPLVQEFEARLASELDVKHCVTAVNGTVALEMTARALGMSEGSVLVPSYTFVATPHSIAWQGGRPVFVDIDPSTHNISPAAVEHAIQQTSDLSGIVAVHLWGRPAAIKQLGDIAAQAGVPLVYDAAHAFGVKDDTGAIGGFGDAEVFSFHATKFFNSFEGGAVTTNNDILASELRSMRNFGFAGVDDVITVGTNGKMTEVCAAMGLANLEHIDEFIEQNRLVHEAYAQGLRETQSVELLSHSSVPRSNYQYVVVEASSMRLRDALSEELRRNNVLARKYFWPGCHRMEAYSGESHPFPLLDTESVSDRVLVLPGGSSVSPEEAAKITQVISRITQELAG